MSKLPPGCVEVPVPAARLAARALPPPPPRPLAGVGAVIGPLRRIAAVAIVCAGLGGGAHMLAPQSRPAAPPPRPAEAALDAHMFGAPGSLEALRAVADRPVIAIPAPSALVLFGIALAALVAVAWRR